MAHTVETVFSPLLYPHRLTKENFVVVVVDILRATTSICAAIDHGVDRIIPVSGTDEAKKYKEEGYLVACERNGKVLDFADIGNSASDFLKASFKGVTIAFSTTNGTQAINMANEQASSVAVGSFVNLSAVARWAKAQDKDVLIFCSGWKNLFNLEDTTFAGALAELLLEEGYTTVCDSVKASIDLWQQAKGNLGVYLSKSSHRNRLKELVSDEDYQYTVSLDLTNAVPVLEGKYLVHTEW